MLTAFFLVDLSDNPKKKNVRVRLIAYAIVIKLLYVYIIALLKCKLQIKEREDVLRCSKSIDTFSS